MSDYELYYDEVRELSNWDLNHLLEGSQDLPDEKIRAILTELEKRGALDDKGRMKLVRLSRNQEIYDQPAGFSGSQPRNPLSDPNIVDDPEAPVLYSRYALRFFSVIFSPFFAGIIYAINFYRLKKNNQIFFVLVFSFIYSYLCLLVSGKYPERMSLILLILNFLGAIVLEELFWNRHIGKNFKFRRQYILSAVLIGVGISIAYLVLISMGASSGIN